MKKSTKKKIRDIRSALVMVLVMVAMLSTASYAWFTLTDSPTATGMNMTAASSGGLQIGLDENGAWADAVKTTDSTTKVLKPVTPGVALRTFETGVYSGNKVVSTARLSDLTDYVATYTYYLHSTATPSNNDLNIGIICGNATQTVDTAMDVTESGAATLGGSIVRATNKNDTAGVNASSAIRVGLIPEGDSVMYIWEPNNDGIIVSPTAAENGVGDPTTPHVSSVMAGTISNDKSTVQSGDVPNVSGTLFTMKEGGTLKVDVYIWLEGKDPQCANQIQTGNIEAQIQFTVVDEAATVNP